MLIAVKKYICCVICYNFWHTSFPIYLITCAANITLNDQLPLDCLAEDPSTASVVKTDDATYRCAKCRLYFTRQLWWTS